MHLHLSDSPLPLYADVVSEVIKIKAKGRIDMRYKRFSYVLYEENVGLWVYNVLFVDNERIVTVGESI